MPQRRSAIRQLSDGSSSKRSGGCSGAWTAAALTATALTATDRSTVVLTSRSRSAAGTPTRPATRGRSMPGVRAWAATHRDRRCWVATARRARAAGRDPGAARRDPTSERADAARLACMADLLPNPVPPDPAARPADQARLARVWTRQCRRVATRRATDRKATAGARRHAARRVVALYRPPERRYGLDPQPRGRGDGPALRGLAE